ncbi:MFS transporter [Candidatus Hydrogenedentota bacterium]
MFFKTLFRPLIRATRGFKDPGAFLALFVAIFVTMTGLGFMVPLLPLYATKMGASGVETGGIFSIFSLPRLICIPLFGYLMDRLSAKKLLASGLFLFALLSYGYLKARNPGQLIAVRFAHGFASAMVIPVAIAIAGRLAGKKRESSSMAIFNVAIFMGFAFGPFIGGRLADSYDFQAPFIAMGVMSLISFLTVVLFLPGGKIGDKKQGDVRREENTSFLGALCDPDLFGVLLCRLVGAIGRSGLTVFLSVYAAEAFGASKTQVGDMIGASVFMTGILQVPFGYLADRVKREHQVVCGAILFGFTLLLIPLAPNFAFLMAVAILAGVMGAVAMPAQSGICVIVGRRHGMGTVMGLYTGMMSGGMLVGPMIGGAIKDGFGMPYVFAFAATAQLLGALLYGILLRRRHKKANRQKMPAER